jgi:multisubunit Na+/H+ antiporter MnhG subunit
MPSPNRPERVSRVATATLVVSFGLLLVCLAAVIFVLPLMGFLGIAMLIGGALFSVVVAGHYLLWGWWIRRILDEERDESA